jgi:hypothetical protein
LSGPVGDLPLLENVREFVGDEPIAILGSRPVAVLAEHDVAADRVRVGRQRTGGFGGPGVGVDSHPAEVVPEARAEARADIGLQWPAG